MRSCVECGVPVFGRGRRLYCSDACALVARSCPTCGSSFLVERKRLNRPGYCSLECRPRVERHPRIATPCLGCGASVERLECQRSEGRGKYCSRSCAALHRPINGKPSQIATAAVDLIVSRLAGEWTPEHRLGRWSIDLAETSRMIAVELDGEYWHSLPEMSDRDRRKDAWLVEHGWRVVRVVITKGDTPEDVASKALEAIEPCLLTS